MSDSVYIVVWENEYQIIKSSHNKKKIKTSREIGKNAKTGIYTELKIAKIY